jgi:phosphoribosylformimino-5-aminoimidazole carboxamide ribotide isomerase
MKEATGLEVIASGGVAGIHDIVRLKETGADGVIAGKALYTGALDLAEALEVVGKEG